MPSGDASKNIALLNKNTILDGRLPDNSMTDLPNVAMELLAKT